ncbi:MAG: TIGR02996 domain-containing protein [Myxococcaceae bacterium]
MEDLLRQLADRPDDLELRRVYGDRLLERGDKRGELIAVQCERQTHDRPELIEREHALLAELAPKSFAEMHSLVGETKWKLGFIDELAIDLTDHPAPRIDPLFTLPETRLVKKLTIASCTFDGVGDLTEVWARFGHLPLLEELSVVKSPDLGSPWHEGPVTIGDLSPLWPKVPGLRRVWLDGIDAQFGQIALPDAERFIATRLDTNTVPALARAQWPRLRYLELEFKYGRDEDPATVFGPLLRARFGEDLSEVRIISRWADWLGDHLADSPLGRGRKCETLS